MVSDTFNGTPTKSLFIDLLTKDISINDAIGDLVDNSLDGALRNYPDKDLSSRKIVIKLDPKKFIITDNSGGIPYDLAKNYAFRFGRDEETPPNDFSVGQFGIGMKRSLFKLGNHFVVKSKAIDSSNFIVDIDVDEWRKKGSSWDFEVRALTDNEKMKNSGTEILIDKLHPEIAKRFAEPAFIEDLKNEISSEHYLSINDGLSITINNSKLKPGRLEIFHSDNLKPGIWKKTFENGLEVKIIVGLGEESTPDGGWYIFCNRRLINGPNTELLTGWGEITPIRIPLYHSQFNRFRGYVLFKSKDPVHLPWNSAKNDIDKDTYEFTVIRTRMLEMMRPVIDYLNKLHDTDQDKIEGSNPYRKDYDSSMKGIRELKAMEAEDHTEEDFSYKTYPKNNPKEVNISYKAPRTKVDALKKTLNLRSMKEVGEYSFDFTYESYVEE